MARQTRSTARRTAPHRAARTGRSMRDLYGVFVEADGPSVAISLVQCPTCSASG
jgi:hypothetical protein